MESGRYKLYPHLFVGGGGGGGGCRKDEKRGKDYLSFSIMSNLTEESEKRKKGNASYSPAVGGGGRGKGGGSV